jgi:hypothetical protein
MKFCSCFDSHLLYLTTSGSPSYLIGDLLCSDVCFLCRNGGVHVC